MEHGQRTLFYKTKWSSPKEEEKISSKAKEEKFMAKTQSNKGASSIEN